MDISYLHQSDPETALQRKANVFLNPPAVEKSIVFCSWTLKKDCEHDLICPALTAKLLPGINPNIRVD